MLEASKGLLARQILQLTAESPYGKFDIEIDTEQLSEEEKRAVQELVAAGSPGRIDPALLRILEAKRISVTDAGDGPICRFDLKCVKINKMDSIDLLELATR